MAENAPSAFPGPDQPVQTVPAAVSWPGSAEQGDRASLTRFIADAIQETGRLRDEYSLRLGAVLSAATAAAAAPVDGANELKIAPRELQIAPVSSTASEHVERASAANDTDVVRRIRCSCTRRQASQILFSIQDYLAAGKVFAGVLADAE